jgi:ribosomal protein S18 acetylase RimI-like enzyme
MIRRAGIEDLDELVRLENCAFPGDRISRRSFRRLLTRAHATTIVDAERRSLQGYVTLLYRAGAPTARLYSIAVDAEARGKGVGRRLVAAAEKDARAHDCTRVKLEIREDNRASIGLFLATGYEQFAHEADYYEDGTRGLFFHKRNL